MPLPAPRHVLALCLGLLLSGLASAAYGQIEELPRPDSAHAGSFGVSVAIGQRFAVVGASGEPSCGPNAGAVYLFRRQAGSVFDTWQGVARITPDTCQPNAFFGEEVVLSGQRLFVSASTNEPLADEGANTAYMFTRSAAGDWRQTARFTGDPTEQDGPFAADIDLDGDRAAVSSLGDPDDGEGGAVYVYDYDSDAKEWRRSARLTAPQSGEIGVLGRGIALDSNRIAVAASTYFKRTPGSVYVFEQTPSTNEWRRAARLKGIDSFLIELDLSESLLLVGEDRAGDERSGRATLFSDVQKGRWTETTVLQPSQPYESGSFGTAVSLDAPWALVTGYGEQLGKDFNIDRVVYVFRQRNGTTWSQRTILDIGQVDFGAALDLHDSTAVVSSVPEDAPGAVYVVQLH